MSEKANGLYHPKWTDKATGEKRESPTWWARYSCRGTCGEAGCSGLHRVSTETDNLNEAKRWRAKKLAAIDEGKVSVDVHKTTYADLERGILHDYEVQGHRSTNRLRAALGHLRERFAGFKAVNITGASLTAYVLDRKKVAADATVRQEMAAVRRMFTLAQRNGLVGAVPAVPSIRVDNARQGFLTDEQIEAVITKLPEDLQPMIEFLALCGWRSNEAKTLKWDAVNFETGEITLSAAHSKNKRVRVLPFHSYPQLRGLMLRQAERKSGPYVFHRSGAPIVDCRLAWRRATREAGVPGALIHDLRRSVARRLIKAGVAEQHAMAILGHQTASVFRRYNIVTGSDIAAATAKLAGLTREPVEELVSK